MMLAGHSTASHSVTGAARWAAPELITCPEDIPDLLSLQSDMYSFGSIMFHVSLAFDVTAATNTQFQILSGVIPYHRLSNNQVIGAIMRGEKPPRPEDPQISNRHWDFIQQCWVPVERRLCRPSANDACDFLQYEQGCYFTPSLQQNR